MKKIIALLVGTMLATTLVTEVFAQSVTDIKGHWGEPYIKDVIEKGLAKGYSDGKFLPDGETTRIEAVIFASNMFSNATIDEVYKANKDKWTSKLRENNIPSWSDKYMVFGLETGIYPETFLKHFMDDSGKQNPCLRYEFITFMVNALGFKNEFVENPKVSFTDVSTINSQVLPYVEVMVRKGIIVGTGEFNATNRLTRAQVSVILSNSYKYASKREGQGNDNKGVTSSTGKVVSMIISNDKATMQLTDASGNTGIYTVDINTAKVVNNGVTVKISDVKIGQNIGYEANGNVITKINLSTPESTITAEFVSYASLEMIVRTNGTTKTYEVNPSIEFKKGSKTVSVLDLNSGDGLTLTVQDNKIVNGVISTITKTVDGIILSIKNNEMIVQEPTGTFTYYIDNTAKMTVDKKGVNNINELSVGDLINASIVNSEVVTIDAITIQRTIKDVALVGISQSNSGNTLIFKDSDGEVYSFLASSDTTYILKGRTKKLADMELGFECNIIVKGGKLLTIDTQGEYKLVKLNGIVTSVDIRNLILKVDDSSGEEYTVSVTTDTIINGFNTSDKKTIRNIFDGDNVVIEGKDNNSTIVATKIIFWS